MTTTMTPTDYSLSERWAFTRDFDRPGRMILQDTYTGRLYRPRDTVQHGGRSLFAENLVRLLLATEVQDDDAIEATYAFGLNRP